MIPKVPGYWGRIAAVLGLVAGTTGSVWVKVQTGEAARGIGTARAREQALKEERSRLQAEVDLALRARVITARAEAELHMTFPPAADVAALFVEDVRD